MRWLLVLIAVLMFAGVPGALAAKDKADKSGKNDKKDIHENWPTAKEISRANGRVQFQSDRTTKHEFKAGKTVKFTPADIGGMNDEERGKGCILGVIDSEADSGDGLKPGRYHVYLRKHENRWQVFFVDKNEAVGFAHHLSQGLDNEHEPKFVESGNELRYWQLQFSY